MFNLLRYFSLTSLAAIAGVTFFLGIFYNHLAKENLNKLIEDQSISLTLYILSDIKGIYKKLLLDVSGPTIDPSNLKTTVNQFNTVIKSAMEGLKVIKIKVYSPGGLTIFSTDANQIGEDKSGDSNFLKSISGHVVSTIILQKETHQGASYLHASYIPMRMSGQDGSIDGVFQVYTDVSEAVRNIEYTQRKIILGIISSLSLLYIVLFLIVKRADNTIRIQESKRRSAEAALNQFKTTLDKTLDCVFMFHPQTLKFFYVNQGAMNQVGYSENELLNMTPLDIEPEWNETQFRQAIAPVLDGSQPSLTFQTTHRNKNGTDIPVEVLLQHISPQGDNPRFVAIVRDITERKKIEDMLSNQAVRDSLTGLYNRRYFDQRISEELLKTDRQEQTLALLLCDLDGFKDINDTHGHQIGDKALKAVSKVLLESIRGSDLVFRWGGDEFIILLPDTNRVGLLIVVERIMQGLAEISDSNKHLEELGISVGIAIFPEHGKNPEDLLRMADRALYIAKKGGENIHIGEEEYSLDDNTVNVVFQPVMDVRLNQVLGYEALSRDPQGKISILALFKKYHAIGKLHELKCLCFRLQIKAAQEAQITKLFINVDFKLLKNVEIPPLPPGMDIVLEISEGDVLDDIEEALRVAQKWKNRGYKFAVDDFGAGFISLPFIARLIPDHIKLDRSTVLQAVNSEEFRSILQDLLHALQKTSKEEIIAEGIETEKELSIVQSMGINLIQGYLFGKPAPLEKPPNNSIKALDFHHSSF